MTGTKPGASEPKYPSFREAFVFWLKLGFISFGGPAGQIGIMHEFLVEKKKWISESRFMHALNYCMVLPGPEAQQLATYTGWLLHGLRGGLTAGLLFILPGLLILLLLSIAYVSFGSLPLVAAFFNGLKPAVIAIIVVALVRIGSRSLKTSLHYVVATVSFVLIYFVGVPFPWIIAGAIATGVIAVRAFPSLTARPSVNQTVDDREHEYVLHQHSPLQGEAGWRSIALKVFAGVVLWCLPLMVFFLTEADLHFWNRLSFFFTKAAFVTFGGAYAVLPYVAQVSVEDFRWLSDLQMIDGLALGETTPGPLILVLVFVGFMAGYNHYGGSLLAGTAGLAVTSYYTFLPSFLLILIGAPLVERTRDHAGLKEVLSFVTAAVVGVILNLTIYFGRSVLLLPSGIDLFPALWSVVSFFSLYRFRVNMVLWILISGIAGILYHLIVTGA